MLNNFNLKDPNQHWSTLTDTQRQKLIQQRDYQNYYNGVYKSWLTPKIMPNGSIIDDNVKVNLAKRIVEKGNNFLFGKGIEWQLDDDEKSKQIEEALYRIWGNAESINAFLPEVGLNGGIVGDYYIQIVNGKNGVKPRNLNPLYVFPTIDPDNDDEAIKWDLRFHRNDKWWRVVHEPKDENNWLFFREYWDSGKWNKDGKVEIWPYPWSFIIHGKNLPNPNSFYGQSDLVDITLTDTINQVTSNLNRIIRIFAHPLIWGHSFGVSDINAEKVNISTNDKASLQALELARDLTSAQDYLKFLRTMQAEITNVPEADPDRLKIGAQSGFALQVLFNDLILKTGIKQALYGRTIIELNRRMLEIEGLGNNNNIKLHWPNPLPVDIDAQTMSDKFDLEGQLASKKTLSVKRGYDYDIEKEYMKQEKAERTSIGEELLRQFDSGRTL